MIKIYQVLKNAKAINSNENINKAILVHLLAKDLAWLYANLDSYLVRFVVSKNETDFLEQYFALIKKHLQGLPLSYILGHAFFHGRKFFVDQNVLIPRSETELLVTRTLFWVRKIFPDQDSLEVLDLCTGSGCIGLTLALEQKKWDVSASDVSSKALAVAKLNQKFHQSNNIKFIESDLFSNLQGSKFDVIISNPPYIDKNSSDYQVTSLGYEPQLALFAENYGLYYYQKIFSSVLNFTKKKFFLALEIGFNQKTALEELLAVNFADYFAWFEKDDSNHWRFLFISSTEL